MGLNTIPVQCGGPNCGVASGAYTSNIAGVDWKSTIYFCDQFFNPERKFLEDIMEDHKRLGWNEGKRHLAGKGRITLHELTHVNGISPSYGSKCTRDCIAEWNSVD